MPSYHEYYTAKYKNVEFLFRDEKTNYGSKKVIHEFPNSNTRYIEDMGIIPHTFTMTIVISEGTDSNGNRIEPINKRIALETAFLTAGGGDLWHPIYGLIPDIYVGTYSVDSSQTSLGQFVIDVTFYKGHNKQIQEGEPQLRLQDLCDIVTGIANDRYKELSEKLSASDIPSLQKSLADKLTTTMATIKDSISKVVTPIQEKVDEFSTTVDKYVQTIHDIVTVPDQLETLVNEVIIDFKNIVETPADIIDAFKDLVDIGNEVSTLSTWTAPLDQYQVDSIPEQFLETPKTYRRQQELNNDFNTDYLVKVNALTNLYSGYDDQEDMSEEELIEAKLYVENLFQYIVNFIPDNLPDGFTCILDEELRDALYDIRTEATTRLNEKIMNSWHVETKNYGMTSLFLETYALYESLDNMSKIVALNKDINNINTQSDMKILVT